MAQFDGALHITAKAGLFTNSRRGCGDHDGNPSQGQRRNEGKIITLPERRHRIGHHAEQQNNRRMNSYREEEGGDKAPRPKRGRPCLATERRGAEGLRSPWRTSPARPPNIKRKECHFKNGSKRHAEVEEE